MDDSCSMALDDGVDHLAEKVSGRLFGQSSSFGDEIEQILGRFGSFHHQHKHIVKVASVQ